MLLVLFIVLAMIISIAAIEMLPVYGHAVRYFMHVLLVNLHKIYEDDLFYYYLY